MGLFSGLEHMIEAPLKAVEGIATELNPMHLLEEGMQLFSGAGMGGGAESASSFLPNMSITDGAGGGGADSLSGGGGDSSGGGGAGDALSLIGDVASIFSFL